MAACTGGTKKTTVLPTDVPATLVPTDVPPTAVPATEAVEPTAETAPVETATLTADLPRFEPAECFVQPPADLGFEVNMDCGYVVVPEFYNGESTRELKIGITRFNSGNGTSVTPLFKLAGGPGAENISSGSFALLQPELLGKVLEQRDIVFIEQRGTKFTDTFLTCPENDTSSWGAYEQGLTGEEADQYMLGTLEKCINELKAQGINFDAYNSLENAADVNAVREALGYDKIIYYGASYGAQLGQHVMRDFPQILEAVVLDGANSLSRKSWVEDRALDAQWGIDNMIELCEAEQKCRETYEISALLDAGLALFDNGPLPYSYTDPNDPTLTFDGVVTINDFASFIYNLQTDKYGVFGVPLVLTQFTQGGAELTAELLGTDKATKIIAARDAGESSWATLMHYAIVCSDDPVKSVDDVITEGAGRYAIAFAQSAASNYVARCGLINVKELPDSTDVNVTTDVPTLLLTGSLDVQTPAFHSQQVADSLPNARLINFTGTSHVQLAGANFCAANILTQFITDPKAELDTTCLDEMEVLPFSIPEN